jgi:predicted RNA-binding Zn-ribbon protein involved in translation (DUF1610 family)
MTQTQLQPDDGIPCVCGDCNKEFNSQDLDMVDDFEERVSPGEIVPAGQCPDCGALAHYRDQKAPDWSPQYKLLRCVEILARNAEAWDGEEDSVKEEHELLIRETNELLGTLPKGGSPKHEVTILWGQAPEPGDKPITYSFSTKAELDAFMEGVEAMDGWMGWDIKEPGYVHGEEPEDEDESEED